MFKLRFVQFLKKELNRKTYFTLEDPVDFTAKFETSKYLDNEPADLDDEEDDSQQLFLKNLKSNKQIEGNSAAQPETREQLQTKIVDLFTGLLVDANNKTGNSYYFYNHSLPFKQKQLFINSQTPDLTLLSIY